MIESYDWKQYCVVEDTEDGQTFLEDYLLGQPQHDRLFHNTPNANQVALPELSLQLEDATPLKFLRHTHLKTWEGKPRELGPPFIRFRSFWTLGDFSLAWNHVVPLWYELGRVVRLLPNAWQDALSLPNIRGHNDASIWLHILFEVGLWEVDGWPISIGTGVSTSSTQRGIDRNADYSKPISDWCFSQVKDVVDASVSVIDILTTQIPPKFLDALDVNTIVKTLKTIPVGPKGQFEFPHYIATILKQLFFPHLTNPVTEQKQNNGRSRIDITFDNQANSGFFYNLVFMHQIKCPYILFECKNYSDDVENSEFSQLVDRFSDSIGFVGFIVCRIAKDRKKITQHCKDRYAKKKHVIIVLDDSDIVNLVTAKKYDGEHGITELLAAKLRPIMFDV
jgi:hypothetical protein